jgi:HlyD family secretion protein
MSPPSPRNQSFAEKPSPIASPTEIIGLTRPRRRRRRIVLASGLAVVVAILALLYGLLAGGRPPPPPRFETAMVSQGDMRVVVTATGTLSARDSVSIGAEISGRVLRVLVDYNDRVVPGQVLAEIDPEQYRARREDGQAQLGLAKAALLTAQATLREADLKAKRLRAMRKSGLTSEQDLETAEAALHRADASLANAKAQITSAEASRKVALSNLAKTVIRSPINGVVLERSVEPGQTVTAGLQTPVVFTLAADLSEMLLAVKVDEADVGQVRPGLSATFTVDAYPNRVFNSTVLKVKNMPTTSQNVVTYETRLSVKNSDSLLRPGMTATATIAIEEQKDVLLVPNAALRFTPKMPAIAEPPAQGGFSIRRLMPPPPGGGPPRPAANVGGDKAPTGPRVFVLRGPFPEPVSVTVGATDGIKSSISGPGLTSGMSVIVGQAEATGG